MKQFIEGALVVVITISITLWLAPMGTYLSFNRNIGQAVWLEKQNMFGQWEKTTVFFGYYNNSSACLDFKDTYTKKYYADEYRCREVKWRGE